jgi:TonB family protein
MFRVRAARNHGTTGGLLGRGPKRRGSRAACAFRRVALALSLSAWAAPAAAQPAPAGEEVVAPRQTYAPSVPYPQGATGDEQVVLELEIGQDGTVTRVTVRAGREPFLTAAQTGVQSWRFEPATRGGIAVRARILVEIQFNERRQELGSTFIPREDARRIPGTFADPFRVTEVMPGVAPILSGVPYFFVRGAPPGDVGYLIDGIRVPLLFHVGAGASVIAPALVERVDFLPSAYPARLGRYAGAIVAGETTALSPVARGEFQARVFDSSAMLEVPFAGGKGSVMAAGRYSYMEPVLSLVADQYKLDYWDYQARAGYSWNGSDAISVFAFGASDRLEDKDLGAVLFDTEFHRVDLRWDHATRTNRTRAGLTFATDRAALTERDTGDAGSQLQTRGLRLRIETQEALTQGLILRTGMEYEAERVSNERDYAAAENTVFPRRVDLSGTLFLDFVAQPLRGVELVPGMRVDTGVWRNDSYFFPEPRLGSRVRLWSGAAWVATFGRVHQLPTQSVRIPGIVATTLESSVQEAWQAAQGLEFVLPSSMLGKVTVFHSWIDAEQRSFSGRNYGVEAFLRRDFSERLGGFLAYTLSRTELTTGRETFPSEFDRPHLVSASLGYDFGAGIRVGVRTYYASGQRFFFGCGPSGASVDAPGFCRRGRLPDFFRLDTRLEKRWTFSSGSWIGVNFEWFNATVSKEAYDVEVADNGTLRPRYQPALTIPSVGLEAGF